MEAAGDASVGPKTASSLHRSIHGSELGCYFCNDVVAPGNVRECCIIGNQSCTLLCLNCSDFWCCKGFGSTDNNYVKVTIWYVFSVILRASTN